MNSKLAFITFGLLLSGSYSVWAGGLDQDSCSKKCCAGESVIVSPDGSCGFCAQLSYAPPKEWNRCPSGAIALCGTWTPDKTCTPCDDASCCEGCHLVSIGDGPSVCIRVLSIQDNCDECDSDGDQNHDSHHFICAEKCDRKTTTPISTTTPVTTTCSTVITSTTTPVPTRKGTATIVVIPTKVRTRPIVVTSAIECSTVALRICGARTQTIPLPTVTVTEGVENSAEASISPIVGLIVSFLACIAATFLIA